MVVTPESILEFWFGGDPSFERIRKSFGELPSSAMSGTLDSWRKAARPSLALVLVLDQFPRNLYRGSVQAFACDPLAREVTMAALERRFDCELVPLEAAFLYLPLEHSEDMKLQERCVSLFRGLLDRAPADQRPQFESFLSFAIRHREIIGRFGRFPHRNALLGRASTSDELSYLESGGDTFGGSKGAA